MGSPDATVPFVAFIGVVNLLGAALLAAAQHEGLADGLLRRWTFLLPEGEPYRHSPGARLWLWWAAIGTATGGAVSLASVNFPPDARRVVAATMVFAYASFEALAIAGSISGRWGPGLRVAHVLWTAQTAWGVWTLFA